MLDLIRPLLDLELCELDLRTRLNHSILKLIKRLLHLGVEPCVQQGHMCWSWLVGWLVGFANSQKEANGVALNHLG